MDAKITEIFSSIQGEGVYVGQPQIFIRLAKCNLNCDYCDTAKRGGRIYNTFELLDQINTLNVRSAFNTVSITGGEPLLYTEFLKSILPQLKKRNFRIYLETNGTLPNSLTQIFGLVDTIAMDMKLPSSQRGQRSFWTEHREFLSLARKKDVFVKVVVTNKTTEEEIRKAIAIIDDISSDIPFVLQPVTPSNRIKKKVSLARVIGFQGLAKAVLGDVRIIPQVHKTLGVR